jgi:Cu(I)/Ag(I) efflux system protein CusF
VSSDAVEADSREGLEMKKSVYTSAALVAFTVLAMNTHAGGADVRKTTTNGVSANSATLPLADGEVTDIDMANQYVVLKHGPIKNLHMEGMTMAFAVKDPAILSKVKVGDKVRFTAENIGDTATIRSLTVQN